MNLRRMLMSLPKTELPSLEQCGQVRHNRFSDPSLCGEYRVVEIRVNVDGLSKDVKVKEGV